MLQRIEIASKLERTWCYMLAPFCCMGPLKFVVGGAGTCWIPSALEDCNGVLILDKFAWVLVWVSCCCKFWEVCCCCKMLELGACPEGDWNCCCICDCTSFLFFLHYFLCEFKILIICFSYWGTLSHIAGWIVLLIISSICNIRSNIILKLFILSYLSDGFWGGIMLSTCCSFTDNLLNSSLSSAKYWSFRLLTCRRLELLVYLWLHWLPLWIQDTDNLFLISRNVVPHRRLDTTFTNLQHL